MSSTSIKPFYDEQGNLVIPHELFQDLISGAYPDTGILLLSLYRLLLSAEHPGNTDSNTSSWITEIVAALNSRGFPLDSQLDLQMLDLARSSMDFWDNPLDDEIWNNA
ncbi:MAG: hypothetical protein R3F46_00540 [bacterium]